MRAERHAELTSVYWQRHTRDERCRVGNQEEDCRRHVGGRGYPLGWDVFVQRWTEPIDERRHDFLAADL